MNLPAYPPLLLFFFSALNIVSSSSSSVSAVRKCCPPGMLLDADERCVALSRGAEEEARRRLEEVGEGRLNLEWSQGKTGKTLCSVQ